MTYKNKYLKQNRLCFDNKLTVNYEYISKSSKSALYKSNCWIKL